MTTQRQRSDKLATLGAAEVVSRIPRNGPPGRARRLTEGPGSSGRSILSETDWRRVGRSLGLSPRELELVQRIFDGRKLTVIAQEMGLAAGTVKTYSQRIYHKLRVSDQRGLALAIFTEFMRQVNGETSQ